MYYKVIKDNRVIDVLDHLIYLKYQPKHKIMVLSDENEAQAILSSDKNTIWHERTLYNIPVNGECYDTVDLVEIDEYEYKQLKMLNGKTASEILDAYTLFLIQEGVI
jgi:hypothetical protein